MRTNLTDPFDIAADIISRISTYDSTAPAPSPIVLSQWADMIAKHNVTHDLLAEGVMAVYGTGGEPPKNKLGSVIAAAKTVRSERRQGEEVRAIGPAPSFDDPTTGYAVPAAYEVDQVITLPCPKCGMPAGEYCEIGGEIKRIPCSQRLGDAYRLHNPEGRRRAAERAEHLRRHARTFSPAWKSA